MEPGWPGKFGSCSVNNPGQWAERHVGGGDALVSAGAKRTCSSQLDAWDTRNPRDLLRVLEKGSETLVSSRKVLWKSQDDSVLTW